MKRLKNVSKKDYQIENKYSLKLKEILREFRQKKLFFVEHSKFATYADSEYLATFQEELIEYSKAWIRLQQKNMNSEKNPGIEGHANARGLHVMDTAINAREVAKDLLLNEDLAFTGGLVHDIAHTAFAHEGENNLSKYLEKKGICELHHSSLSRLILELEEIHNKVIKRLEEKKGKPLSKRQLKDYYSTYLTISDIAVCHNGEGGLTEVASNTKKSDEDIENEYINTFTKRGLDRRTRNRSKEGAIVLFCDPISYIAKDFRDGIIKGLIDVNDSEYEEIFIKMGLSKETLDKWALQSGKKDKLVSWITRRLKDNLVSNSTVINGARMDREMADLMYELRNLNYEKVVKPGHRKINDILPQRLETLIERYSNILLQYESGQLDSSLEINPYRHKLLKSLTHQSDKVNNIYATITKQGIEENIRIEIEDILSGNEKRKTVRRQRFEEDISELKSQGKVTVDVKEAYIQRVLKEVYLSPSQSKNLLKRRIQKNYPEASPEEIKKLMTKQKYLRLDTYLECLSKLKVAIYVGESTNDYLLDMLEGEGLISPNERKKRYVPGGDVTNASITDIIAKQKEEKIASYSR